MQDKNSLNSWTSPMGTPEVFAFLPERAGIRHAYSEGKYLAYQTVNPASQCQNCTDPWDIVCQLGKISCEADAALFRHLGTDTSSPDYKPAPSPSLPTGGGGTPASEPCGGCDAFNVGCEIGKLSCELTNWLGGGTAWLTQPCIPMVPIPCIGVIAIGTVAVVAMIFGLSRR